MLIVLPFRASKKITCIYLICKVAPAMLVRSSEVSLFVICPCVLLHCYRLHEFPLIDFHAFVSVHSGKRAMEDPDGMVEELRKIFQQDWEPQRDKEDGNKI